MTVIVALVFYLYVNTVVVAILELYITVIVVYTAGLQYHIKYIAVQNLYPSLRISDIQEYKL